MTISQRHIEHLRTILNNDAADQSTEDAFESAALRFLENIGNRTIRLSQSDWRGHAIRGMLWHFDDLKPGVQQTLSRKIIGQWRHQDDPTIADASQTFLSEDQMIGEPAADENMDRHLPEIKNGPMPHATEVLHGSVQPPASQLPPSNTFLTNLPPPRRDWFDRFTDWVAAVLSLLS